MFWKLFVDVTEKLGCWAFGMADGMHHISYCKPQGGFAPPDPPGSVRGPKAAASPPLPLAPPCSACLEDICAICKSLWGGVVL